MLSLTQKEMERGRGLTPPGAGIERADRPTVQDQLDDAMRALDNENRQIRKDAVRYLGRMGHEGRGAVGKLKSMMAAEGVSEMDLYELVTALGLIGPDAAPALEDIKALSHHKAASVRCATVWGVARIQEFRPECLPFLRGMLGDPDTDVAARSAIRQVERGSEGNP
jgi:HEAT repeat protein